MNDEKFAIETLLNILLTESRECIQSGSLDSVCERLINDNSGNLKNMRDIEKVFSDREAYYRTQEGNIFSSLYERYRQLAAIEICRITLENMIVYLSLIVSKRS